MLQLSSGELKRLWKQIAVGGPDDCWLWTGATAGGKKLGWYGQYVRGRREVRELGGPRCMYAHRVMFCVSRGYPIDYIGSEQAVMHTCDNHLCCNPSHLALGTQLQNIQDMIEKNRNARGHSIGKKLTEQDVRAIKARLRNGENHQPIADEYGVTRPTISLIAAGKSWSWVEDCEEVYI